MNGDQACVAEMNKAFKERHDFVVAGLNDLPGVSCLPGAGTFYAFADVSKAIAGLGCRDDNEFAEILLNAGGVAVVPGSGFGAPGHIRLSFACGLPTLAKALEHEMHLRSRGRDKRAKPRAPGRPAGRSAAGEGRRRCLPALRVWATRGTQR